VYRLYAVGIRSIAAAYPQASTVFSQHTLACGGDELGGVRRNSVGGRRAGTAPRNGAGRRSRTLSFYPISLTQLSTRGMVHNLAAIAQTKKISNPDGQDEVPIYRVYFDGMIAHFQRQASLTPSSANWVAHARNEEDDIRNGDI